MFDFVQWFSKCGTWTSGINITWLLVRNARLKASETRKQHPVISVFISPLGDSDIIQVSFLAFKHIFKVEQDINSSSIDNCDLASCLRVKEK